MSRWAAVFDGVSGYAAFASVTFTNNTDLDVWITFNTNQPSGIVSNGGVGEYFRYSSGSLRFRSNGNGGLTAWSWTPTLGVQYKLSLRISATGVELLINDISQGTASGIVTNWNVNTIALYNTTSFADCEIERLTITDNTTATNSRDWLNEVVAGSSVNWPDVSGNGGDATLTDTPTDGSQWLLVSGGSGVTGSSDITIPEPLFSISGTATLPQPTGNISFNIDAPLFSSTGEATLPQPSGSISFNISEPVFSVVGSATLPQPSASISFVVTPPLFSASGTATTPNPSGTVDFSVAKPVFSSTGSASLPQPSGAVSFEISKPLFSGSGSASLPNPQGVVSFNIDKPIFSAVGSATLPNPIGSISFSIDAPLFGATGTVSGLNLPLGTVLTLTPGSSTITVNTGSNALKLPYTSNTIKL